MLFLMLNYVFNNKRKNLKFCLIKPVIINTKFVPKIFLLSAITPNLDECILEKFDSISTYHINHWFNGFTKLKIKQ
ncbi:MAG: hypothetical protein N4A54_02230 [Peptostreptococcaceae bacterium]|jgi:hypothetical protein|nr:hypothetical protein [Peptostreptococcaceae bacterium]